jgi:putative transposase
MGGGIKSERVAGSARNPHLRRLLLNQPVEPEVITTDGLKSYPAALDQLGLRHIHRPGRLQENNRAENSHLPIRRRERKMQGFKSKTTRRGS